jgi:hypothetical protein
VVGQNCPIKFLPRFESFVEQLKSNEYFEAVAKKLSELTDPDLDGTRRLKRMIQMLVTDAVVRKFTLQNAGKDKICLKSELVFSLFRKANLELSNFDDAFKNVWKKT